MFENYSREERVSPMTGLDSLREEQGRMKMSTGSPDLDSLVGGIEEGNEYLFYGDSQTLGILVHSFW